MRRRRSQPSSAALTRVARDDVVRWVRRHVHPTGHRRRAYCRAPAVRGPARRVRKIEGVPDDRRCVVVGAGLLGLSAAWALTRRGWNVVVLEAAGAPGHERSGSKGDARIFRLGYPEPHYVEMAMLARQRWRDLEAATGRQLLHVTGQVTLGDEATLRAIAGALVAAGAPVEQVPAGAAARRFPGIAAAGMVLVESGSGVLAADDCLRALQQAGGFEVDIGRRVTSLRQSSDSVTVGTADGAALQADVVVDCAGPAALGLLGVATTAGAGPPSPRWPISRHDVAATSHARSSLSGATTCSTACRCPAAVHTPARTRWPTTRPGLPSTPSILPTRPRSRPTTRHSSHFDGRRGAPPALARPAAGGHGALRLRQLRRQRLRSRPRRPHRRRVRYQRARLQVRPAAGRAHGRPGRGPDRPVDLGRFGLGRAGPAADGSPPASR